MVKVLATQACVSELRSPEPMNKLGRCNSLLWSQKLECRVKDSWGKRAARLPATGNLRLQQETLPQKRKVDNNRGRHLMSTSGTHSYVNTCVHMYTNMHSCILYTYTCKQRHKYKLRLLNIRQNAPKSQKLLAKQENNGNGQETGLRMHVEHPSNSPTWALERDNMLVQFVHHFHASLETLAFSPYTSFSFLAISVSVQTDSVCIVQELGLSVPLFPIIMNSTPKSHGHIARHCHEQHLRMPRRLTSSSHLSEPHAQPTKLTLFKEVSSPDVPS